MVTDPGAMGIHIFDFAEHKYKFIARNDKDENSLRSPQCVAVDARRQLLRHRFGDGENFRF